MTACVPGGWIHDLRDDGGRAVSCQTFLCFINTFGHDLDTRARVTRLIIIHTLFSVLQQICAVESGKHSGGYP